MADIPQDQAKEILASREQYKTQLAEANKPLVFSQSQMTIGQGLSSGGFLAGVQYRQAVKGEQTRYRGQVIAAKDIFEKSVAKAAPEVGEPEYVEKEYEQVKSRLQTGLTAAESDVNSLRKELDNLNKSGQNFTTGQKDPTGAPILTPAGQQARNLEHQIDVAEQRVRAYKEGLGMSKFEAIKLGQGSYFEQLASGYASQKEQYYKSKEALDAFYREHPEAKQFYEWEGTYDKKTGTMTENPILRKYSNIQEMEYQRLTKGYGADITAEQANKALRESKQFALKEAEKAGITGMSFGPLDAPTGTTWKPTIVPGQTDIKVIYDKDKKIVGTVEVTEPTIKKYGTGYWEYVDLGKSNVQIGGEIAKKIASHPGELPDIYKTYDKYGKETGVKTYTAGTFDAATNLFIPQTYNPKTGTWTKGEPIKIPATTIEQPKTPSGPVGYYGPGGPSVFIDRAALDKWMAEDRARREKETGEKIIVGRPGAADQFKTTIQLTPGTEAYNTIFGGGVYGGASYGASGGKDTGAGIGEIGMVGGGGGGGRGGVTITTKPAGTEGTTTIGPFQLTTGPMYAPMTVTESTSDRIPTGTSITLTPSAIDVLKKTPTFFYEKVPVPFTPFTTSQIVTGLGIGAALTEKAIGLGTEAAQTYGPAIAKLTYENVPIPFIGFTTQQVVEGVGTGIGAAERYGPAIAEAAAKVAYERIPVPLTPFTPKQIVTGVGLGIKGAELGIGAAERYAPAIAQFTYERVPVPLLGVTSKQIVEGVGTGIAVAERYGPEIANAGAKFAYENIPIPGTPFTAKQIASGIAIGEDVVKQYGPEAVKVYLQIEAEKQRLEKEALKFVGEKVVIPGTKLYIESQQALAKAELALADYVYSQVKVAGPFTTKQLVEGTAKTAELTADAIKKYGPEAVKVYLQIEAAKDQFQRQAAQFAYEKIPIPLTPLIPFGPGLTTKQLVEGTAWLGKETVEGVKKYAPPTAQFLYEKYPVVGVIPFGPGLTTKQIVEGGGATLKWLGEGGISKTTEKVVETVFGPVSKGVTELMYTEKIGRTPPQYNPYTKEWSVYTPPSFFEGESGGTWTRVPAPGSEEERLQKEKEAAEMTKRAGEIIPGTIVWGSTLFTGYPVVPAVYYGPEIIGTGITKGPIEAGKKYWPELLGIVGGSLLSYSGTLSGRAAGLAKTLKIPAQEVQLGLQAQGYAPPFASLLTKYVPYSASTLAALYTTELPPVKEISKGLVQYGVKLDEDALARQMTTNVTYLENKKEYDRAFAAKYQDKIDEDFKKLYPDATLSDKDYENAITDYQKSDKFKSYVEEYNKSAEGKQKLSNAVKALDSTGTWGGAAYQYIGSMLTPEAVVGYGIVMPAIFKPLQEYPRVGKLLMGAGLVGGTAGFLTPTLPKKERLGFGLLAGLSGYGLYKVWSTEVPVRAYEKVEGSVFKKGSAEPSVISLVRKGEEGGELGLYRNFAKELEMSAKAQGYGKVGATTGFTQRYKAAIVDEMITGGYMGQSYKDWQLDLRDALKTIGIDWLPKPTYVGSLQGTTMFAGGAYKAGLPEGWFGGRFTTEVRVSPKEAKIQYNKVLNILIDQGYTKAAAKLALSEAISKDALLYNVLGGTQKEEYPGLELMKKTELYPGSTKMITVVGESGLAEPKSSLIWKGAEGEVLVKRPTMIDILGRIAPGRFTAGNIIVPEGTTKKMFQEELLKNYSNVLAGKSPVAFMEAIDSSTLLKMKPSISLKYIVQSESKALSQGDATALLHKPFELEKLKQLDPTIEAKLKNNFTPVVHQDTVTYINPKTGKPVKSEVVYRVLFKEADTILYEGVTGGKITRTNPLTGKREVVIAKTPEAYKVEMNIDPKTQRLDPQVFKRNMMTGKWEPSNLRVDQVDAMFPYEQRTYLSKQVSIGREVKLDEGYEKAIATVENLDAQGLMDISPKKLTQLQNIIDRGYSGPRFKPKITGSVAYITQVNEPFTVAKQTSYQPSTGASLIKMDVRPGYIYETKGGNIVFTSKEPPKTAKEFLRYEGLRGNDIEINFGRDKPNLKSGMKLVDALQEKYPSKGITTNLIYDEKAMDFYTKANFSRVNANNLIYNVKPATGAIKEATTNVAYFRKAGIGVVEKELVDVRIPNIKEAPTGANLLMLDTGVGVRVNIEGEGIVPRSPTKRTFMSVADMIQETALPPQVMKAKDFGKGIDRVTVYESGDFNTYDLKRDAAGKVIQLIHHETGEVIPIRRWTVEGLKVSKISSPWPSEEVIVKGGVTPKAASDIGSYFERGGGAELENPESIMEAQSVGKKAMQILFPEEPIYTTTTAPRLAGMPEITGPAGPRSIVTGAGIGDITGGGGLIFTPEMTAKLVPSAVSVPTPLAPTPAMAPTPTFVPSITPIIGPSLTPSISPTPTITPSITPTITPGIVPSITPVIMPVPTLTPTIVPTPAITPTITPVITPVITPIITPVVTPVVTPTPVITPTIIPVEIPYVTPKPLIAGVPLTFPRRREEKKKKKVEKKGYEVYIRRKKKFVEAAPFALPSKREAVAYGARITLGEAAATFQVRPSKKPVREVTIPPVDVGKYFRPPKAKGLRGPDIFIQKERARIITPGEKREISFKGIAVRTGRPTPSFTPKKSPTTFLKSKGGKSTRGFF